jgi:CspA family cold shock protein
MQEGKIKRVTDRGFGFITYEGAEKDLFFHSSALRGIKFDELREGDTVSFEIGRGPKSPNATDVEKIS